MIKVVFQITRAKMHFLINDVKTTRKNIKLDLLFIP